MSKHIKAILSDGELDEKVVVNYKLTTTRHGAMQGKEQSRKVAYYNPGMILAIGYRLRSLFFCTCSFAYRPLKTNYSYCPIQYL